MKNPAEYFMHRCFQLAKKGINTVAPNPMVGCVITIPNEAFPYGEEIIGEGYHRQFGGPHAEVNAVNSVTDQSLLSKATAYVSLEPCSHFGKTPPCADLLIRSGFKKVVVACYDPNEKVAGAGVARLKAAGVDVVVNVLQTQAIELNRRFITFQTKKRPYVVLKWAQTADGFIAAGEGKPKWISNPLSRQLVHSWRSEEAAIMVGNQTVINDNPQLNTRGWAGPSPVRIVIGSGKRIPENAKVLDGTQPTLIYGNHEARITGKTEFIMHTDTQLSPVLEDLHQRQISSVLVEGGARLLQSFIDQDIWDEARIFHGNMSFGEGVKAPVLCHEVLKDSQKIDNDLLNTYIHKT